MRASFRLGFFLLLGFCLVAQAKLKPEVDNLDSHLKRFSDFTVAHHDNIDDSNEYHSHRHKHSEDGEEHEHDHEHSKASQSETKIVKDSIKVLSEISAIDSKQSFTEKNLISNPHPSSIYRPPIMA